MAKDPGLIPAPSEMAVSHASSTAPQPRERLFNLAGLTAITSCVVFNTLWFAAYVLNNDWSDSGVAVSQVHVNLVRHTLLIFSEGGPFLNGIVTVDGFREPAPDVHYFVPSLFQFRMISSTWTLAIYLSTPALASLVASLIWLTALWWRRSQRKTGYCQHCGYDLRASTTCCPECGLEIDAHAPVVKLNPPDESEYRFTSGLGLGSNG